MIAIYASLIRDYRSVGPRVHLSDPKIERIFANERTNFIERTFDAELDKLVLHAARLSLPTHSFYVDRSTLSCKKRKAGWRAGLSSFFLSDGPQR